MSHITDKQITDYLRDNIGSFHNKRLKSLNSLELDNLLRRKNPYLFRSKIRWITQQLSTDWQ